MGGKPTYLRDFQKNVECKKSSCLWNPTAVERHCYATTDRAKAVRDNRDIPVEVNLNLEDPRNR